MNRHDSGSILIEAMVAAALVALMLGTMYQALGDSAANQNWIAQKRIALLVAQSEMDAIGPLIPLAPGTTSGTEGPYVWQINIGQYPAGGPSNAGPLLAVTVSVRARSGGPDLATLSTLALGSTS